MLLEDYSLKRFQPVSITRHQFVTSPTITWDPGDLQWNTLLIDCSSPRGAHFSLWHICSISNGSRDNSSTRFQRVSVTRHQFVTSHTITWDPGELPRNTLLIDCSSHRGAHFSHWHICSILNGSRDYSSTRFLRGSITRHHFVTSPTITWDPGDFSEKHTINRLFFSSRRTFYPLTYLLYLKWFSRLFKYKVPAGFHYSPPICYITHYNLRSLSFTVNTLLIDCSSPRGAHFSHWHICSISNGSRDNSNTRFQRVSITRHQFVTSPTITWDPDDLQRNTLLIDCSSHRGAHFSHWHNCSILNASRRLFTYKVPAGFRYSPPICYITHYNLRSRSFTVNTLLIDCSSHRGAHFSHWHICSISNGSRDKSSTRFQRVSITRHQFVTSPTITWDPGDLQWNTLLIDCSSPRGAHFSNWHICFISNGSRDDSSTRFRRVSITLHHFVTSPTITWDPGDLQRNTLLIDCSSHRGAHFSHWHIWSILNGSRDYSSTRFLRVSITRHQFFTSHTITWDPGVLQ